MKRVCSPRAESGLREDRTRGTFLRRHLTPWLALPHLHHVLDQLRPQLVHSFIHRCFDLSPRGVRVFLPPLGHPQHISQSCTHLLHLRTPLSFVLLGFHALASLLLVFPVFYHLPSLCKKMNRTLTCNRSSTCCVFLV